jgi:hypothetical protein
MNRVEIPIASPCAADWTTMTLADRGRFCGECRKVVRELARMSEREARALLAAPPAEGLCVRYIHDATGEIVFRHDAVVPVARLARRVAAVALAVALPVGASACSSSQPMMGAPPSVAPSNQMVMMGAPPPPAVVEGDAGAPASSAKE